MSTPGSILANSPTTNRNAPLDHMKSWTDDLPVCHLSGVGFSTNQYYREDGFRREEHEFEDKSFHFKMDIDQNEMFLYGVFDGHDGSKASNFAAQRMPAEILLGQIAGNPSDEEIKSVLYQAFISVEKGFFDSIDEPLATKAKLVMQVPEGIGVHDGFQHYPEIFNQLQDIEKEITGGTTAVVCLHYNNKLYVANVGCSRALLCLTDSQGVIRVKQITVDHNLSNADELARLKQLRLDIERIQQQGLIGNHDFTRTLGDYHIKSSYKEHDILKNAQSDPLIPTPDLYGAEDVDEGSFLIIMSDGLYKSIDTFGNDSMNTNVEIARMVAEEFGMQSTMNGVAQAVVDKVVRKHHDAFTVATAEQKLQLQRRDDITLLVRNFGYPMPYSVNSPRVNPNPVSVPYRPGIPVGPPSVIIPTRDQIPEVDHRPFFDFSARTNTRTNTFASTLTSTQSSNDSTQSGDEGMGPSLRGRSRETTLELDKDGKVKSYIDFSDFNKVMEKMSESKKEQFLSDTTPKPDFETIPEEKEPTSLLTPVSPNEPASNDSPLHTSTTNTTDAYVSLESQGSSVDKQANQSVTDA